MKVLKKINTYFKRKQFQLKNNQKKQAGTVEVRYTQGAGNNIFQYVFGRLLAEHHDMNLSAGSIDALENEPSYYPLDKKLKTITIGNDDEYNLNIFFSEKKTECNFIIKTYAEDYTIYKPHIKKIKSWFNIIPTTNTEDLVFHLRLGDRLVLASTYDPSMLVSPKEYCEAIEKFSSFSKLHIVTDIPFWRPITTEDVINMRFHYKVPDKKRINPEFSVQYFNSLYFELSKLNPIVRIGYSIKEDFDYIRSFDKILFQHGTLAWWAATLSNASEVGVYGPWRPVKGDKNKNLGETDFPGWFKWGTK